MTVTVHVPADSASVAVGADAVAEAIAVEAAAHHRRIEIVRTGSRGLYWLEPLVEVSTDRGRIGFGPVNPEDVPALVHGGLFEGTAETKTLGVIDDIDYLKNQSRLTMVRCGIVDPRSIHHYRNLGGFEALGKAIALGPETVIDALDQSGLRGRGGAGFPVGRKWRSVLEATADQKYVVCNADEGDSGTFSDRMLMEGDPFALIEGMIIAGLAVGATEGFIYLRSEYPHARVMLEEAITRARADGYLGPDVAGSGRSFDIELRIGAGSYVCGEETAMLESLEGRRGEVRYRPPLPAVNGLFGRPTAVNNVITLATVPVILARGADAYRELGHGDSRGTLPLQLSGNVRQPGLVEVPLGVTLGDVLEQFGGGTASGRPIRAVQVGGPTGAYFPADELDIPIDYEAFAEAGAALGHGGIVVFDDSVDMAEQARFAFEFCAEESCGKCTPCRIGSVRGAELVDRIRYGGNRDADFQLLDDLCATLEHGSLCGMGALSPLPVRSAIRHFREDFTD